MRDIFFRFVSQDLSIPTSETAVAADLTRYDWRAQNLIKRECIQLTFSDRDGSSERWRIYLGHDRYAFPIHLENKIPSYPSSNFIGVIRISEAYRHRFAFGIDLCLGIKELNSVVTDTSVR